MAENKTPPFTRDYVIRTTVKHCKRNIEISTRKTLERVGEFAGDPEKSSEIFKTLTELQTLKNAIEQFENANPSN